MKRCQDPAGSPQPLVEGVPGVFTTGTLALVEWPKAADQLTTLETPETVTRHMPEFWLDLSGKSITNFLYEKQHIHGSNLVKRRDVLLFGSNLQVDSSGRWACETRTYKTQFLEAFAADKFNQIFPGPKPVVIRSDASYSLDFGNLGEHGIRKIAEPVFLATPLEPGNWGRWVVTVMPKLSQYISHGQGRRLFCHSALSWQRKLLTRFGVPAEMVLNHDPGCTYFCKDLMTVDYGLTNMTISRQERALFSTIAEDSRRVVSQTAGFTLPRRVFVSRMSMSRLNPTYRVLQNEQELADALSGLGFSTIEPETLDFDEQVAIFAGAEIIVCLGGAALYNAVFCNPNAMVIDIESSEIFLGLHADLLGSLQIRYGMIIGQQDESDELPIHKRWTVDVPSVLQQLRHFV